MSPEGETGLDGGVRRTVGELTLWFVGLSENTAAVLRTQFLTVVLLECGSSKDLN